MIVGVFTTAQAQAMRSREELIEVMKRNQFVTCEVKAWKNGELDPFTGKKKLFMKPSCLPQSQLLQVPVILRSTNWSGAMRRFIFAIL